MKSGLYESRPTKKGCMDKVQRRILKRKERQDFSWRSAKSLPIRLACVLLVFALQPQQTREAHAEQAEGRAAVGN